MNRAEVTKTAVAWLQAHDNLWSHHLLARLIEEHPLDAWRIIESMISRTEDEATLRAIGIGPIEDILSENGSHVVEEVERFARAEPKLLTCLRAAWKSDATDEVWGRVEKLLRKRE